MWVFGTYSPLPKKMEWRSHEVEAILAQTQEVLLPPMAAPDIGKLRMLTLIPFAFGINDNPDGATLSQVLPEDVYARWVPLKQKYLGKNDKIERMRPIFAADRLYWSALDQAGLVNGREMRKSLDELIKKNKLKTTTVDLKIPIDSPVKAIREFKKSPMDDTACFSKTLERVETDIEAMRIRANAWAKGDLEAIRRLTFPDREGACTNAMLNSSVVKGQAGFQDVEARLKENWLAAVDTALATNKTTFAILSLKNILDPNGYIAALKAKGYQVEDPE